jgi:hypothetical protein
LKRCESVSNPSGKPPSCSRIVIEIGAETASFGNVTVAPPTTIDPPSGPIVEVCVLPPEEEEDDEEVGLVSSDDEQATRTANSIANFESCMVMVLWAYGSA